MEIESFCEIEDYPRKVLAKHWPDVPIYSDVREVKGQDLNGNIYCGGFPCQDISVSGNQAGLKGKRSGLWYEFKRIMDEGKPDAAIIENVANLRSKGLVTVLDDLRQIGYNAEWNIISAGELGFPHLRERIWIVAYPNSAQLERGCISRRIQQKISNLGNTRRGKDKPGVERMANGIPSQMDRLKCLGNAVVPIIPQIIGESLMEIL
jgi:DNA (cytosine-5)-methyltransferase 1